MQPGVGGSEGLEQSDDLWDLTLSYLDLFDALGLERVALVGHSYGGMVAAEIAAMAPERVSKLVLVGALGLRRDDTPVLDYWTATPAQQAAATVGKFADRIPDARVELLEKAGHLPHLERMDRFAPLVTDFCR